MYSEWALLFITWIELQMQREIRDFKDYFFKIPGGFKPSPKTGNFEMDQVQMECLGTQTWAVSLRLDAWWEKERCRTIHYPLNTRWKFFCVVRALFSAKMSKETNLLLCLWIFCKIGNIAVIRASRRKLYVTYAYLTHSFSSLRGIRLKISANFQSKTLLAPKVSFSWVLQFCLLFWHVGTSLFLAELSFSFF